MHYYRWLRSISPRLLRKECAPVQRLAQRPGGVTAGAVEALGGGVEEARAAAIAARRLASLRIARFLPGVAVASPTEPSMALLLMLRGIPSHLGQALAALLFAQLPRHVLLSTAVAPCLRLRPHLSFSSLNFSSQAHAAALSLALLGVVQSIDGLPRSLGRRLVHD